VNYELAGALDGVGWGFLLYAGPKVDTPGTNVMLTYEIMKLER
jgi:hypothetical protein